MCEAAYRVLLSRMNKYIYMGSKCCTCGFECCRFRYTQNVSRIGLLNLQLRKLFAITQHALGKFKSKFIQKG